MVNVTGGEEEAEGGCGGAGKVFEEMTAKRRD